MNLTDKVIYTFNKFFSSFLKEFKDCNEDIKRAVKQNYKVIDKMTNEYILHFGDNLYNEMKAFTKYPVEYAEFEGKELAKDMSVGFVVQKLTSEGEKAVFWNYMSIFMVLCHLHKMDEECDVALFEKVVKVIGACTGGDKAAYEAEIADILDDDIKGLLSTVSATCALRSEATKSSDIPDMFAGMADSKICNLAKEISSEIDLSSMDIKEPADLMKMLDFSGNNNFLGNMISKVSTKLNEKITSGDIKQEDLVTEAMSMMNMLNNGNNPLFSQFANNPLMANLMKNMKGGKAAVKQDVLKKHDTRERLRRKLDQKKSASSSPSAPGSS
jgi:hypothetical protein